MNRSIYILTVFFTGMLLLHGCDNTDTARVGFVLIRADQANSSGPRASGLDRAHVAWAECQVLDASGAELIGGMVPIDNGTQAGEQEVALDNVPVGDNRFARIRGLQEDQSVWECGATGPFSLEKGQQYTVTIIIHTAREQDPRCEQLCTSHQDCPADSYCPSLCARQVDSPECTEALCDTDYVGRSCISNDDCGQLSCLLDGTGWPGGYCSAACLNDLSCTGRALCVEYNSKQSCIKTCSSDEDCRMSEGYGCTESQGKQVCLPKG